MTMIVTLVGCKAEQEIGVDPYAGGKEALGIIFTSRKADPELGKPGEVVRVNVRGLKKYESKFTFRLNEVPVEIIDLSDSTIDIRIPNEVSSGIVTVLLNGQIFAGPRIGVEGKVAVDTDYKVVNGFNGSVLDIYPNGGGNIFVGGFTNFEDEATETTSREGIHFLNSLGQTDNSMIFDKRVTGNLMSIAKLPNGQFLVAGGMTAFNGREVDGIARLNANGRLDTVKTAVINPEPLKRPLDGVDTVSALNGGVFGSAYKVFATPDSGAIVIGGFSMHRKIDYRYSSRENRRYIYTQVNNVAKLKYDGSLDSSFNIKNTGFNGFASEAVQLKDGRIVIVGRFVSYNGKPAKNIICIKPDGSVDEAFMSVSGTDKDISMITYNPTLDKIVLAGAFRNYGGVSTNGVVVLNSSGAIDQTFTLGDMGGEMPNYAYKLNSGKVVVSGGFTHYMGIRRSGFLILEADGTAKQEYNNMGGFVGAIYTLVETTSSLGNPAILLGGFIFAVDNKPCGNIVKIEIKN